MNPRTPLGHSASGNARGDHGLDDHAPGQCAHSEQEGSHAAHVHAAHADSGHTHAEHTHPDHTHAEHAHAGPEGAHSGQAHSGHSHLGHHVHAPADFGRAFAIGVTLNLAFVVVEALYGWRADSLALIADAAHNLSDVAGLALAWVAVIVGRRRPTMRNTYGLKRATIIASFINAVVLLLAMGSLAWEAAIRLSTPEPIAAVTVMVVAAIGVAVNGVTAWLFMAGGSQDLNIRGAFLHMASDALVSLAVVAGGALYLWKGWGWIDPALSLAIAVIILIGTWSLFRQSLHLMLDGVPGHIRLAEVEGALLAQAGVHAVHDLHVWATGTSSFALTAHLVLADEGVDREVILARSNDVIRQRFKIQHVTLQVESGDYALHCGGCDNAGNLF